MDAQEALARRIDELCAENEKLRGQGERLFDKTLELGTENAKLRQERREYQATIDSLVDECADHKAENAKLRELCKDMYENPYALSECWECPHCGDGCISNCYYRDRLRELGIEVD